MTAELLKDWLVRAKRKTRAHTLAANHYQRLHYWTGIPSAILSAVTGTAVFAEIQTNPATQWKYFVVAIVLLAAALTAVQTFLNFGERARQHKSFAARFSKIRREIDVATSDGSKLQDVIPQIQKLFDEAMDDNEPSIPNRIWKDTEKKYPTA